MNSLKQYLNENLKSIKLIPNNPEPEILDEGLRDILNKIKNKFSKVAQYFRGLVAKIGKIWYAINDSGEPVNAISPLTAGQLYKDGRFNKSNTLVVLDREGSKIIGLNTKSSDAFNLYGRGNSLDYWRKQQGVYESGMDVSDFREKNINEVRIANRDPQSRGGIDTPALKKRISAVFRMSSNKYTTLLIFGAPGIGKTAILSQVIDEMNASNTSGEPYKLIVKTLSNETVDNFTIPEITRNTETGDTTVSDLVKSWLPVFKDSGNEEENQRRSDACGRGILFLDELSRTSKDVLNVCLPLINEHRFNNYLLGYGWRVICASNRPEDDMQQTELTTTMTNRCQIVYYEPTVNSWRKWAETQNYMSPVLLDWLESGTGKYSGSKYFYWDPNDESDSDDPSKIMCTPRSWTNCMEYLATYYDTGLSEGWQLIDLFQKNNQEFISLMNDFLPAAAIDSFCGLLGLISKVGDIESFCDGIWKSGKANIPSSTKLDEIVIPISQIIITYHAKTLPTEKEFMNLSNWLISQNNGQLASYMFDNFNNVFGRFIENDNEKKYLVLYKRMIKTNIPNSSKYTAAQKKKVIANWNEVFKNTCTGFGVTPETFPDYSTGYSKLFDAYKSELEALSNELNGSSVSAI